MGAPGTDAANEFGCLVQAVGTVAQDGGERTIGIRHIDFKLFPALFLDGGDVHHIDSRLVYICEVSGKLTAGMPGIDVVKILTGL